MTHRRKVGQKPRKRLPSLPAPADSRSSVKPIPPLSPAAPPQALPWLRKRSTLVIIFGALLTSAVLVLVLTLRLPLPARLAVAGGDVIAAVMVALVLRQSGKA